MMFKKYLENNQNQDNHINLCFTGKFSPFTKGHLSIYSYLQNFAFDNNGSLFLFTNLTKDGEYFTAKQKKDILELSGISKNNLVDNNGLSGYNIKKTAERLNLEQNDILVFIFSKKDAKEKYSLLQNPAYEVITHLNKINKSHTINYIPNNLSDMEKLKKEQTGHAYIYIMPSITLSNEVISSSRVREAINNHNWDEVSKLVVNQKVVNYLRYINKATDFELSEGAIEKLTASYEDILNKIKDKTLIFYDTETTGLDPKKPYVQLIEIAAIAQELNSGEKKTFNKKIQIQPGTQKSIDWEKENPEKVNDFSSVTKLLDMTGYYDAEQFYELKETLVEFKQFIESFQNPLVIAHNLKFDMYQLQHAMKELGIEKINATFLDTMTLVKFYLVPLFKFLKQKEDVVGKPGKGTLGLKMLTNAKGNIIFNLGVLGKLFDIKTTHWHSGLADSEQLSGIFQSILNIFAEHKEYLSSDEFKQLQLLEKYKKFKRKK